MDLQVEFKEEPVWCEGETNTSFESVELVSDMKLLKQEYCSELTEPGPTQENAFEDSADIKEEISLEQHVVKKLVPHVNEENNVENTGILTGPTGKRAHGCTVCSRTFANEFNLSRHMLLAHSAEMPCLSTVCDATLRNRTIVERHKLSRSRGKLLVCKHCSCNFTQQVSLEGTAQAAYSCQECKKQQNYVKPIASQSREKPYTCTECKRGFSTRGCFQKHMITHCRERSHSCTQCNREYTARSSLRDHMLTHNGEKPYSCTQCNRRFHRLGNLRTHMVTHSAERPYLCTQCSRGFNTTSNLRKHMITHSSERPYSCAQCNRGFSTAGCLRSHMITHTSERPYICAECGRALKTRNNLLGHMKKHTR